MRLNWHWECLALTYGSNTGEDVSMTQSENMAHLNAHNGDFIQMRFTCLTSEGRIG